MLSSHRKYDTQHYIKNQQSKQINDPSHSFPSALKMGDINK